MKLLEDNTGENSDDFRLINDFLITTSKMWLMKKLIDKCDFIKIKNLAIWKTLREWGQALDW